MTRTSAQTRNIEEEKLIQLIVFRTGDEEFCVPIDEVLEIIKVGDITPIPDAPTFMKGIINVRGDIVAIIDLKSRFYLQAAGYAKSKHIIITKQENVLFGLMVDEVLEVLRVKKTDVNTAPSIILKMYEGYVNEIVVHEDRLIILLDLPKILSQNDLVKLSTQAREHHKENPNISESVVTTVDANDQASEKNISGLPSTTSLKNKINMEDSLNEQ